MADSSSPEPPDLEAVFEPLEDRVRAWWAGILTGEPGQDHPIYGSSISVRQDSGQLTVAGVVPSEDVRERIVQEAAFLVGRGASEVVNEMTVVRPDVGAEGILSQIIVSVFPTMDLALLAKEFLEEHPGLELYCLWVEAPETEEPRRETLDAQTDKLVRRIVSEGNAALVVSVDELHAFHVRTLLDEESRSLQTFVQPPHPTTSSTPPPDERSGS